MALVSAAAIPCADIGPNYSPVDAQMVRSSRSFRGGESYFEPVVAPIFQDEQTFSQPAGPVTANPDIATYCLNKIRLMYTESSRLTRA